MLESERRDVCGQGRFIIRGAWRSCAEENDAGQELGMPDVHEPSVQQSHHQRKRGEGRGLEVFLRDRGENQLVALSPLYSYRHR